VAWHDITCRFPKVIAGRPERGTATWLSDAPQRQVGPKPVKGGLYQTSLLSANAPLVSGSWSCYEVQLPCSRFSLIKVARGTEIDHEGTFENMRNEVILNRNVKFFVNMEFSAVKK